MSIVHDTPARAILARLTPYSANLLSMAVREPIRRGVTDPATIPSVAEARLLAWEGRNDRHRDASRAAAARAALDVMVACPDQLVAFIGHCLEWEALPPGKRAEVKQARGHEHRRAWLAAQPATERQIAFCRALGHTGPIESKQHASEIIERLKGWRVA